MKKAGVVVVLILIVRLVVAQNPVDTSAVYPLREVNLFKEKDKRRFLPDLVPSTLIDNETIERTNSESVAEAVQVTPGVVLKDYGGIGGLKTVSVRSLGAEHTLVMLNGVKLSDAQTGAVDLGRFSVENVEAIRLYKGNSIEPGLPAIAYSSAAVIDICTGESRPESNHPELKGALTSGSFNYFSPALFVKKSIGKKSWAAISGVYRSSKGNFRFLTQNGKKEEEFVRSNADLEDFKVEGDLFSRIGNAKLSVKLFFMKGERGLPGAVILYNPQVSERLWNKDYFVQAKLEKHFKNGFGLNLYGKAGKSYLKYLDPDFHNKAGFLENEYNQDELYFSASAYKKVSPGLNINIATDLAYNYLDGDLSETTSPKRLTSFTSAIVNLEKGKFKAQGGAVNTTFSDFNQNVYLENKQLISPVLFAGLDLRKNLTLRASYKETYRLPTFNDLYYNFIGNTGLMPENTHNFNMGLSYRTGSFLFFDYFIIQSDLFYNQVKNKIIAVPTRNIFVWSMRNLGKVEGKGIELYTDFSFKTFAKVKTTVTASYTYQTIQDVTDKKSPVFGHQIAYTPWETASVVTSFEKGSFGLSYNILFSGYRYALGQNIQENFLDGFATHDLSVSYLLSKDRSSFTIKLEANNLFNRQYQVIKSFPMPGRHFKIKLLFNYA